MTQPGFGTQMPGFNATSHLTVSKMAGNKSGAPREGRGWTGTPVTPPVSGEADTVTGETGPGSVEFNDTSHLTALATAASIQLPYQTSSNWHFPLHGGAFEPDPLLIDNSSSRRSKPPPSLSQPCITRETPQRSYTRWTRRGQEIAAFFLPCLPSHAARLVQAASSSEPRRRAAAGRDSRLPSQAAKTPAAKVAQAIAHFIRVNLGPTNPQGWVASIRSASPPAVRPMAHWDTH